MNRRFRAGFFVTIALAVAACGWDPSRPFERESPQVNEALTHYDAGEAGAAADLLEDYLTTGACKEGSIGTPLRVRERSNGSFDLGLAMFGIAEQFGHRFGDEENDAGLLDPNLKGLRSGQVECALHLVRAVSEDATQPPGLRARARYLEGNLLFLNAAYKEAVTAYDLALELVPAMTDAGPIGAGDAGHYTPDAVGADAAWNRAIALRRIEDKKDAGNDASSPDGGKSDDSNDGGKDDKNKDGGKDKDGGQNDRKDSGPDKDDKKDAGQDSGANDPPKHDPPKNDGDAGEPPPPPPPSRQSQDDRILDQLENAPTVQQEAAKKQNRTRKALRMEDK